MATNRRVGKPSSKKQKGIETDFPIKKRQWINMKKTLLALAVMTAAGSVNAAEVFKTEDASVDFYGQLREYVEFSDVDGSDDAKINKSSSRWGVKVNYQVNDDFAVLGKAEVYVEDSGLRQHYIGFASESFGTVTVGQQLPFYDDIYGAIYPYQYDMAPYANGFDDNFWQSSAIAYQLSRDAFWVKAMYNLPENDTNPEMGEAYVGTSFGDLSVHVGGAFMDDQVGANNAESTYAEATAEYAIGSGVIGFTYAYNKLEDKNNSSNDQKSNGFHLGAKFEVADKTSVYGQYQYLDFDKNVDETQNVVLGVEYIFSSWARSYVEYNFHKEDSAEDANNLALGARIYW
ncbi:porin [Vibrio fluvialis]|nr:porin [Vibrio fluvialis]